MRKFKRAIALMLTVAMMALAASVAVYAADYDTVITILHTNDVHSRTAGYPYLAAYLKELTESENVILVSAGDDLHGQPLATLSTGGSIVDLMNEVGYLYATPGNHDFNYGTARLLELEKNMKYKLLSANFVKEDTKEPVFSDSDIIEIAGVKLGLFGLATPETATKTNPKNVEGYIFEKPVPVAEAEVKKLKEEGAEVIVVLSHLGLDTETLPDEQSQAVAAVPGIDVIIDGHSHTLLETGKVVSDTLIAQTGEYLENIGIVKIYLKDKAVVDKTASLLPIPSGDEAETSELQPEESVVALIDSINEKIEAFTSAVIGNTPVTLEGARENVRHHETNLTNLITAAMIHASGADASLENGGGVRATIEAGPITKGDVVNVLPFGNFIVVIDLKGSELLEALEHGVDTAPEVAAHISQVGGISVVYDSSKEVGNRVASVTFDNGEALDPDKTYKVATNDFMAAGGDNYTMLDGKPYMIYSALDEALINYISSGIDFNGIKMGRLVDAAAAEPTPAPEPAATEAPAPVAEPEPAPAEPAAEKTYVVVKGDCLYDIAKKLDVASWQSIASLNGIKSPYVIQPGQTLLIP
jgi:5'-nucleotidase